MTASTRELDALGQPIANNVTNRLLQDFNVNTVDDLTQSVDEQSTRRLARGVSAGTVAETRDNARRTSIPIALSPFTWDEPPSAYNASYPHNRVMQTRNGHVQEFDDTPGSQRYHRYHPSGTYVECDSEGNETRKIVGDGFLILEKDGNVYVSGNCNLTVGGTCNILVLNNCNMKVGGSLKVDVGNDIDMIASGCFNLNVKETFKIRADNMVVETTKFNHKNIGTYVAETNTMDVKVTATHTENSGDYNLKTTGQTLFNSAGDYQVRTDGKYVVKSAGETQIDASKVAIKTNLHLEDSLFVKTKVEAPDFEGLAKKATYADSAGRSPLGIPSPTTPSPAAPSVDIQAPPDVPTATPVQATGLVIPSERINASQPDIVRSYPNTRLTRIAIQNDGDERPADRPLYPGYSRPAPYIAPDLMQEPPPSEQDSGRALPVPAGSRTRVQPVPITNPITDYSPNTRLSQNFTVGNLSTGATSSHDLIIAQRGLNQLQIAQSLQYIAVNILEPIAQRYGRNAFEVSSGFRRVRPGQDQSQHGLGEAVDIQFKNISQKDDNIRRGYELLSLIPFDLMLLETADKNNRPWIHISFGLTRDQNKNIIGPNLRYAYATYHNHANILGPGRLSYV